MLEDLSPAKILIIVFLIVVFFGAKKIPEIAQGVGKGLREFRKAAREITGSGDDQTASSTKAVPGTTTRCFYCHSPVALHTKFCPSCGKSLESPKCTRCKTLNSLGNKFCSACGAEL